MLVLISIPIVLGVIIAAVKPEGVVAWINEKSSDVTAYYNELSPKWTITYGWKAIVWCFHKLSDLTAVISDEAYRAAVRACLFFYVAAFCFYAALVVLYLIVALIILAVELWILGQMLGTTAAAIIQNLLENPVGPLGRWLRGGVRLDGKRLVR
jgi:hypothetical protein